MPRLNRWWSEPSVAIAERLASNWPPPQRSPMSRLSALAVVCTVMIAAPGIARLSASSRQSPAPRADAMAEASPQGRVTPPPPPAAPPPATAPQGGDSNVRVELAISEAQAGTTTTKNVVLITSNVSKGSIRSDMSSPVEGNVTLNVDAQPRTQRDGRISLDLTFVYTPQRSSDAGAAGAHSTDIMEHMDVILTDGKPLVVSQSADPRGDRKVTVEVTATILK